MATIFSDTDKVFEFMEENMVILNFRGEDQEFLPRSAFEQVTTKDVIRLAALEPHDFLWTDQALENFVDRVYEQGRIMFATCFYAQGLTMNILKGLLDQGLTDADIPLPRNACANTKLKRYVSAFRDNQKRFYVADFQKNSYQDLDGITKPINFEEKPSNLLGRGAFGEVWSIKLHSEHHSLLSRPNQSQEFALKVTQQESRELDFHDAMRKLSHPHLLKCLASFTFDSKYHMIYEKADCNVEDFMKRHENAQNLSQLSGQDLAEQLYGLAEALSVIHNQEDTNFNLKSNLLSIPQKPPPRSGYIHDIKPENLLLFIYERNGRKRYWFRLSDFSCAKVVEFVAVVSGKRWSHLSDNKAGTPTYRAPERLMEQGTSRPYDMWSLGCVYLELLVWFLDGHNALDEFRDARSRPVKPGGMIDDGFCFMDEAGPTARVQLREEVVTKMAELSERCSGALKDIADAIPKLLEIEPKRRLTAEQLVSTLKHLATDEGLSFDAQQPGSFMGSNTNVSPIPTPAYDSDSDCSSFDGLVKVTRPTQ
ncbi:kinase-like domain-containing protein [Pyrenochaeta sp. MPI-SDFR-AT-0127]|nr:kinase-like domain-containing protein [Pyrenochaeta sp. MPI-SDFR-AT-0127]